jgi:hypothetical protein
VVCVDSFLFILWMRQRHAIRAMIRTTTTTRYRKCELIQDQREQDQAVIGSTYGIRRDGNGLTPIHCLQARQEALAHAAFEVIHADEMGEMSRDDQISGKPTPIEHGGVSAGIAIGDAKGDCLRIRTKLPDNRRSDRRRRIAGVQHQDFLIAANVDGAEQTVQ